MTVAVSKARRGRRRRGVVCASTGNTAASAAAYAARAGLVAVVLQPAGAVASGKLAQARALGARLLEVRGSFDEALARGARARRLAGRTCSSTRSTPTGSRARRPPRSRSSRSSAARPTCSRCRTAAAATLRAYARGLHGERRRNAALVARRGRRAADDRRVRDPHRRAGARGERRGGAAGVRRSRRLAHRRGDPRSVAASSRTQRASSASPRRAAGLAAPREVELEPGSRVVCVVTGHGLKDPETAARLSPAPVAVDADPDAIEAASR